MPMGRTVDLAKSGSLASPNSTDPADLPLELLVRMTTGAAINTLAGFVRTKLPLIRVTLPPRVTVPSVPGRGPEVVSVTFLRPSEPVRLTNPPVSPVAVVLVSTVRLMLSDEVVTRPLRVTSPALVPPLAELMTKSEAITILSACNETSPRVESVEPLR